MRGVPEEVKLEDLGDFALNYFSMLLPDKPIPFVIHPVKAQRIFGNNQGAPTAEHQILLGIPSDADDIELTSQFCFTCCSLGGSSYALLYPTILISGSLDLLACTLTILLSGSQITAGLFLYYSPTKGHKLYNPTDITNELAAFYKTLYNLKDDPKTAQPNLGNIGKFLDSIQVPDLSNQQQGTLTGPFMEHKALKAIQKLKPSKAPGPDRFTNAYCKKFTTDLTQHLTKTLNAIKTTGQIPQALLGANIITLPKPGKSPTTPEKFWPISLLNTDVKLYARLLADRIKPLLPQLIKEDQVGHTTMENKELCTDNGDLKQNEEATTESVQHDDVDTTGHIVKDGCLVDPKVQDGSCPTEESALLNSGQQSTEAKTRPTICMKLDTFFICPPQGALSLMVTNVIMVTLVWGVVWSITGAECLPGGNLFGILTLFLCAVIGGKLVGLIKIPTLPPLPPLLGMLLAGFLIRNIPFITDLVQINYNWSAALRNIALAIILTRAGLGLDPKALRKLKAVCLRLSLGPCAIESCTAAVLAYLLMGLPLTWGFMLGFVLGAVSPAVVVPSMLILQKGGFGVEKGIPTLLMAAGSFDDILAITGFNTCLGMAFSSGSTINSIVRGVLEVVVGIAAGLFLGFFLHYFPSKDQKNVNQKRSFLILALSIFAVFGSLFFGFPGSGGLCTLVMAFVAGIGWSAEKAAVEDTVAVGWDIFQPLLFGLIGAEISVVSLRPETVGLCVATLSIALVVRIFSTFLMVCCAGFKLKEKIFISLAWIPKATVQAAIGSVALDTARSKGNVQYEEYGMDVLTVAFLGILITAPIGALIIGLTGPKMLQKASDSENTEPTAPDTCASMLAVEECNRPREA
ncbi:sodium/hydrogen exchanger 9B2-like [Pelodytes ibericus]